MPTIKKDLFDGKDAPRWSTVEFVEVPISEATSLALYWAVQIFMTKKRPDLAYTNPLQARGSVDVELDSALLLMLIESGIAVGYSEPRTKFVAQFGNHTAQAGTPLKAAMMVACKEKFGDTVRVPQFLQEAPVLASADLSTKSISSRTFEFEYPKPLGNLRALGYTLGYSEARDDWTYMVPEWLHDDNVRARELGKYRWIKGDERCSGFTQAEKDAAVAEGRAKKAANQFRKDE